MLSCPGGLCPCHQGGARSRGRVGITSCRGSAHGGVRPEGPEGRGPLPPSALAPLLFFPIEERKHFLLLLLALCPGRPESRGQMGRMGNPPPPNSAQAMGKGRGPASSGLARPLDPWCPGKDLPRVGHRVLVSKHTGFYQCFPNCKTLHTTWIITLFVFKSTHVLKTSISALIKQA